MGAYDPGDFQDLSQLVAFRQRKDQLQASERHIQEVASLKRAIQSQELNQKEEKNRRDNLYKFKNVPEEINAAILAGDFHRTYQLIKTYADRFSRFGFRQEDFSTIEYKELAEGLTSYFERIEPYFESVAPKPVVDEIRAREALELENQKLVKQQLIEKQEAARKHQEERARKEFKKDMTMVFVVGAVLMTVTGFLALIFYLK